jgi:hypothetical protein
MPVDPPARPAGGLEVLAAVRRGDLRKGEREGEKIALPKTVRLACYTLTAGIADYHGCDSKQEAEKTGGDADSPG